MKLAHKKKTLLNNSYIKGWWNLMEVDNWLGHFRTNKQTTTKPLITNKLGQARNETQSEIIRTDHLRNPKTELGFKKKINWLLTSLTHKLLMIFLSLCERRIRYVEWWNIRLNLSNWVQNIKILALENNNSLVKYSLMGKLSFPWMYEKLQVSLENIIITEKAWKIPYIPLDFNS
jgi:hypothetical protein